ncbi:hypothetical protein Ancab_006031 [Ancistrocladus abbreviatus]
MKEAGVVGIWFFRQGRANGSVAFLLVCYRMKIFCAVNSLELSASPKPFLIKHGKCGGVEGGSALRRMHQENLEGHQKDSRYRDIQYRHTTEQGHRDGEDNGGGSH